MSDKKNTIFDEIKTLEEKKDKLNKSIYELNEFSIKIKDKLNEEDIEIETKTYKINIEKEKLKNDHELDILTQDNDKLEKYLLLLAKQYELELKYIEQYCDHKSKVEKLSEKYAHVNFNEINSLRDVFNKQLNNNFTIPSKEKEIKPPQPPPPPIENNNNNNNNNNNINPNKRRNTIATIVKNPNINNNDIRNGGNLQSHLKNALNTKYKALKPPDSDDDNSFSS